MFSPLATFPVGTGSVPFGTPFTFGTAGTPVAGLSPVPTTRPAGTGVYSFPVGCDDAMYIGETDPVDKTVMKSGEVFDKGWSLQNVGTCTWDKGYRFVFKTGDDLHGDPVKTIQGSADATEPGHSQAFVVHNLMAPFKPGEYVGYWQMQNASGVWFGSIVSVDIIVR